MNAVDFIKSDMGKKSSTPFTHHLILYFFIFIFSLVYGYVSRDDHGATLRLSSVIAGVAGFIVLVFSLRKPKLWILGVGFLLSIQTAILNSSPSSLWDGTLACFLKGCLTTIIVGLILAGFTFRFASWPVRRERMMLALSAGLSGALMLEIHCDSAFMGHVLVGHVLQGLVSGLVVFGILEIVFIKSVKASFPNIDNIQKLG